MTTTQSKETRERLNFVARVGHGHLTPSERWLLAELVSAVGLRAELGGDEADDWRVAVREYRRLVPEGGA